MKYLLLLGLIVAGGVYYCSLNERTTLAPYTDLNSALSTAYDEEKYLFILLGREHCPNCRALRNYIEKRQVKLSEDRFILVDLNCDDPTSLRTFQERFQADGNELPVVVVADSYGRQFATRSGFGNPAEFNSLINDAVAHIERGF